MAEETRSDIATIDAKIQMYLVGGEQTQITPEIQRLADTIAKGDLTRMATQIFHIIHQLENRHVDGLLNSRTADEIIRSGFRTGCTDMALAFTVIARATGIPTKIVETVDRTWLTGDENLISGHVYTKVYDDKSKCWVTVDPTSMLFATEIPADRLIVGEGIDVWDMGMKSARGKISGLIAFKEKWREENSK